LYCEDLGMDFSFFDKQCIVYYLKRGQIIS
jgi:hypothetical protein